MIQNISKMSPTSTFYSAMVAPKTYQHHHRTVQCYLALARLLKLRLKSRKTAATAPTPHHQLVATTMTASLFSKAL
jgi:hypothetical protein